MIWTAPPTERIDPGLTAGEREAYESWLGYHRDTMLGKCAGLSAEQLRRRAVPPSELSLLGLVRHLTGVERWWFRVFATGELLPLPYRSADNPNAAFTEVDGADPETDVAGYRAELAAADEAVRDLDLDQELDVAGLIAAGVPVPVPFRPPRNLRWVYLHMIEEYARHNGHADLLREVIDGAVGI